VFDGFRLDHVDVGGLRIGSIRRRRPGGPAGARPSRTHTTWYAVAPALAQAGYSVVCPDLRGSATRPPADRPDHSQASKRAMAGDLIALMATLGHDRFHASDTNRGG